MKSWNSIFLMPLIFATYGCSIYDVEFKKKSTVEVTYPYFIDDVAGSVWPKLIMMREQPRLLKNEGNVVMAIYSDGTIISLNKEEKKNKQVAFIEREKEGSALYRIEFQWGADAPLNFYKGSDRPAIVFLYYGGGEVEVVDYDINGKIEARTIRTTQP